MQQFFDFVVNHWVLWSALILVLLILIRVEMMQTLSGVMLLRPQEVTKMINHDNAVIVDVRSQEDFERGHIIGAVHIPSSTFGEDYKKLNKYKTKPIIVNCQNGQVSPQFGSILKKNDFQQVYVLKGGLQAWQGENLPVVRLSAE